MGHYDSCRDSDSLKDINNIRFDKLDSVIKDIERELAKDNRYRKRRIEGTYIRSAQICALIMYLIDEGIIK